MKFDILTRGRYLDDKPCFLIFTVEAGSASEARVLAAEYVADRVQDFKPGFPPWSYILKQWFRVAFCGHATETFYLR